MKLRTQPRAGMDLGAGGARFLSIAFLKYISTLMLYVLWVLAGVR
jgi:hypothetical protein